MPDEALFEAPFLFRQLKVLADSVWVMHLRDRAVSTVFATWKGEGQASGGERMRACSSYSGAYLPSRSTRFLQVISWSQRYFSVTISSLASRIRQPQPWLQRMARRRS